jgi:hypothetical protein
MIGYWVFDKNEAPRNFAQSGYGKLNVVGSKYSYGPIVLPEFYLTINSDMVSGEIFKQDDLSIGLIGVNGKCIPYLRYKNIFHKPDNRYVKEKSVWGIEFKEESFADKDYTVSFYSDNVNIYNNGTDEIKASGHICFPLANQNYDIKLFAQKQEDSKFSDKWFTLFGASGSIGSGMPLYIGMATTPVSNAFNIAMNAFPDLCYLMDESGNFLLDELGDYLLDETCVFSDGVGITAGFDLYMNADNTAYVDIPLYLAQSETSVAINSGIPLYMYSANHLNTTGVNLFLANTFSGIGSGVNLFIEASGENEGYIPLANSMPLFIQRGENAQFDMYISGAAIQTSGQINLTLQATQTPIATGINLSMRYVHNFANSGINLYTAGW